MVWRVKLQVEVREILLPNVLHSLGEVAKLLLDLLLTLALALLVLDLIRVVHVTTTAVQVLHRLHHLLIELDVLRLLLTDHDRILQVEMNQRLNLLLGRLEEGEANVFVHDIDLFVHLGADVSQTVRVRLESARLATAATAECRQHPQACQAVHAPRGEHKSLLTN